MTAAPAEEPGGGGDADPKASEKAEPAPEPEPDQPAKSTSDTRQAEDIGDNDVRAMNAAINVFHAPLYVEGGTFGIADGNGGGSRRATGLITAAVVDEALRWYVEPAEFGTALDTLREYGIVVLVGAEGTGKRALALRLLREVCQPDAVLVSVSPAASLLQLATTVTFAPGHGYLVADHIGDGAESAVRGYDADRLADKVRDRRAHLVITTTSGKLGRQHLRSYAVTVHPPEPGALLDRCLGEVAVDATIRDQARGHVARQRLPREVVRLAKRLIDDPDGAAEAMRDQSLEQVTDWLDGHIAKQDLLSVTAVAITGSQPEPTHDVLVDDLRQYAEPRQGEREAAPYVPPDKEEMKQRRRDHPLLTTVADDEQGVADWYGGRRIRFRNADMRAAVLAGLHERYGYELWRPVRSWVQQLCAVDLEPAIQVELASGIALLARSDFADVHRGFLESWANGVASERITAAMVLWFSSADDGLASVALRTAMSWGQDRGLRRAVTSALALGGPLGVRFPGEAMRRLCFLALRAKRIGVVARLSVGLLFATAVDDGADSAGGVLATVYAELDRAITADGTRRSAGALPRVDVRGGQAVDADSYVDEQLRAPKATGDTADGDNDREDYERGWSYRVVVAARWLVVAVLSVEQPDRDEPVTAKILLEQPDNIELLGTLWADVLCSAPHAPASRKSLLRLLRALEHNQSATDAVARLGAAVHAAMPLAHRSLRIAELMREANREAADRRPPEMLVSTLLAAIGGSATRTRTQRS